MPGVGLDKPAPTPAPLEVGPAVTKMINGVCVGAGVPPHAFSTSSSVHTNVIAVRLFVGMNISF
jgi:hypothetical protein